MASYLIGRHAGAIDWFKAQGKQVDHILSHLDINTVNAGDNVIGTLPVHLVYQICLKGASYHHLSMEIPESLRGKELTSDEMELCNARIETYYVKKIDGGANEF